MNVSGLSLRDLEYVVAVVEERHFGRAAGRCNVSQPALSAQVRKLEEALALTLFERTSRRVIPTPVGEDVARQARAVLTEAQRLLAIARDGRETTTLTGRLSLGAIQTLGPYLFPLVLRGLREAFPELKLVLSEDRTADLIDRLRDGQLDVALLSPPIDESGLELAPLFTEPFLLACPSGHPLAQSKTLRPRDLAGGDLLLLDEGNCLRDQAVAACEFGHGAGRHATSLETLRSMVAAGGGYTLLPALARPEDDRSGLVAYREFTHGHSGRDIAMAWRATDPRRDSFLALAHHLRVSAPPGTLRAERGEAASPEARRPAGADADRISP